ncbi:MAG: YidC/Oxa1 family membrane protein insertase, partial [Pirellulales bacterium]
PPPTGWLGPYLNVLPLVTIALFLWQQKMFMPPPADEQAAMQQKIMSYMMIFIGVMFFKVASGLCIYFIASSAWGIAERKLLPKMQPAGGAAPSAAAPVSSNGTGSTKKGGKKQRGKR